MWDSVDDGSISVHFQIKVPTVADLPPAMEALARWRHAEHGVVDLRGQTVEGRARLLISVAHPAFREELEREAHELRLLPRTPHGIAARSRDGRPRRGPQAAPGADRPRTARGA